MNNKDYIDVIIQSLKKKNLVLDEILAKNVEQAEVISKETMDFDKFDEIYQQKEKLIKEITLLDSGFEKVYNRIKEILEEDRESYKEEINIMKDLIRTIISKAADVEVSEKRNHDAMSEKSEILKKQIKTVKMTNKVAAGYYQTMNKLNYIEPQFMDKKK